MLFYVSSMDQKGQQTAQPVALGALALQLGAQCESQHANLKRVAMPKHAKPSIRWY